MLGHKKSLGKFKKIEIVSSIFSDHNAMKLEINYNTKTQNSKKYKHTVTKQYAAKQPLDHQRNQRKKKKNLETNENKSIIVQNLWEAAKAVLTGKCIAIQSYLKEQAKSQINSLTPKTIRERTNKT